MQASPAGLSKEEAQKRLEAYGKNELAEGKKKSLLVKFAEQIKDFMILVLLAAAIISAIVSHEIVDSIIILLVELLCNNGGISGIQGRAAIEALKQMSTPNANVLRDGHTCRSKVMSWFQETLFY